MVRRLALVTTGLVLCAQLAFASEGSVRTDLLDGLLRVTLDGSYAGAHYGVARADRADAAEWTSIGEQNALCTGDCYVVDPDAYVGGRYWYRFDVFAADGSRRQYGPFEVIVGGELVTQARARVWPNPTRGRGTLRLMAPLAAGNSGLVAEPGEAMLLDLAGRRVATLWSGSLDRYVLDVPFEARDERGRALVPGLYFVRFRVGSRATVSRVAISR